MKNAIKMIIKLLAHWLTLIYKFMRTWHELWMFPLALGLFFTVVPVILAIDPEAGVYDMGYLLVLVMATVYFIFGHGVVWLMFYLSWPEFYRKFKANILVFQFTALPWQRVFIPVFVFCFYLWLFFHIISLI